VDMTSIKNKKHFTEVVSNYFYNAFRVLVSDIYFRAKYKEMEL